MDMDMDMDMDVIDGQVGGRVFPGGSRRVLIK